MQQLTTLLRNLLATKPTDRSINRHAHGLLKRLQELNPQDYD